MNEVSSNSNEDVLPLTMVREILGNAAREDHLHEVRRQALQVLCRIEDVDLRNRSRPSVVVKKWKEVVAAADGISEKWLAERDFQQARELFLTLNAGRKKSEFFDDDCLASSYNFV